MVSSLPNQPKIIAKRGDILNCHAGKLWVLRVDEVVETFTQDYGRGNFQQEGAFLLSPTLPGFNQVGVRVRYQPVLR